jgi:hypothetical protein
LLFVESCGFDGWLGIGVSVSGGADIVDRSSSGVTMSIDWDAG